MLSSHDGSGHIRIYGTLALGHTQYEGYQRIQCWPFSKRRHYGYNREDFVFIRPPGVESFLLSPDSVWYCRVLLIFSISVKTDVDREPVELQCAFVAVCKEISLDPAGI